MLVILWYILTTRNVAKPSIFSRFLLGVGLLRTLSCGGWVYVTSTDDHGFHDFAMIFYMVCTLPHMLGTIATTDTAATGISSETGIKTAKRARQLICSAFFISIVPLVYYFIQHKVHRVAGGRITFAQHLYIT